jgi:hypothetical protein
MANVAVQKKESGATAVTRREELKNGELTVVVPKTPAAVAKRIPVASGDTPKA